MVHMDGISFFCNIILLLSHGHTLRYSGAASIRSHLFFLSFFLVNIIISHCLIFFAKEYY